MAVDKDARHFSLTWDGGYLTTTVGLLKALYGADFMDKAGAGKAQTIAVKGHTRTRVIGGAGSPVAGYSYSRIKYPRKLSGMSSGGQPIKIEVDGKWWTARLGGSVQDFKAFLSGAGASATTFQFMTEKGGLYSSKA